MSCRQSAHFSAVLILIGFLLLPSFSATLPSAVLGAMQEVPGGDNDQPLWSPSGDRILFTKRHLAKTEIYVMGVDGSQPRRLTTTPTGDSTDPAWSPDGKRIVYSSGVRINTQIYVMNADGSGARRLTSEGKNGVPAWSPDGRRIAFISA